MPDEFLLKSVVFKLISKEISRADKSKMCSYKISHELGIWSEYFTFGV